MTSTPGCRRVARQRLIDGGVGELWDCESIPAKVKLAERLALADSTNQNVRRLAERICAGARSALDQQRRLQRWVQVRVVYTRENPEQFTRAPTLIETLAGDCDDSGALLVSLLTAMGHKARLRGMRTPGGPHVCCQVWARGKWRWLETIIQAEPGEHPVDAARRLGVVGSTT